MSCPGRAIRFAANSAGVTLDCAGFTISTTNDRAISAGATSGITITNCVISTNHRGGRGIVLTDVSGSTISNNSITTTGPSSRAIQIRGESTGNTISNNTVHTSSDLTSQGIRLEAGANINVITNNTFQADASYAVSLRSVSGNQFNQNTLISSRGYIAQERYPLQNGGLGIDSSGNFYAIENNFGSSIPGTVGIGTATAFFLVDPATGAASSIIPVLDGGANTEFGFDELKVLPNGDILALTGGFGLADSPLYQIDPLTGEVTPVTLNIQFPMAGGLNGLEATSNTSLLATTNRGELVNIDLTTGIVSLIGEQSVGWTGIAIHPTIGTAYTVSRPSDEASNTSHLYEINIANGQVIRHIGDSDNIGIRGISDIEFSPAGILYGNTDFTGLAEIDLTTGAATIIGAFGPDILEPLPQNNSIENTVVQTSSGTIHFTGNTLLPSVPETEISTSLVQITSNSAKVDSTTLAFLDTPARITLTGLSGTERSLLVDEEDDGTFTDCGAARCTLVSFSGGSLVFDVTGFTTYSSEEPDNGGGSGSGTLSPWMILLITLIYGLRYRDLYLPRKLHQVNKIQKKINNQFNYRC